MPSVRYLKRWKIRALDKILYCSFFRSTLHLCHSNDPKYDEFINYYRQHIFLSRCFFLSVVFELPSPSTAFSQSLSMTDSALVPLFFFFFFDSIFQIFQHLNNEINK